MQCIGQINLSINENCEAFIWPSMLIPDLDELCNGFPGVVLELFDTNCDRLEDELGNATNRVTGDMVCLLYTSPSPRDKRQSRMPSSA